MILDAFFLTKEQLQERKALEAEKKLKKDEAQKLKEEEEFKKFRTQAKEYKDILLLDSDYEPFYLWGLSKEEKKLLCVYPDNLPGYCRYKDFNINWLESCKRRYLEFDIKLQNLKKMQKEDEEEKS